MVKDTIAEYRLAPVAQEKIASSVAVAADGGAAISARNVHSNVETLSYTIPRPGPCSGGRCGGIRVPHVHYEREIYLLTDKQWTEFSQKVIESFQNKLAHAKGINFEQLMKLSDAMGEIISSE